MTVADLPRDTLAMILAGGQGERLYPLTKDRSKPSVPFGGLYRIIDFTDEPARRSACAPNTRRTDRDSTTSLRIVDVP